VSSLIIISVLEDSGSRGSSLTLGLRFCLLGDDVTTTEVFVLTSGSLLVEFCDSCFDIVGGLGSLKGFDVFGNTQLGHIVGVIFVADFFHDRLHVSNFTGNVCVSLDNFFPHSSVTLGGNLFLSDLGEGSSSFLVLEDSLSLLAEFFTPVLDVLVFSTLSINSSLVEFDISEVELFGLNVVELESEGFVGLFVRGSVSSLEVEHDIEVVGVLDVSQETDEALKELNKVLGARFSEHLVDFLMVSDGDLFGKLEERSFLVGCVSSGLEFGFLLGQILLVLVLLGQ